MSRVTGVTIVLGCLGESDDAEGEVLNAVNEKLRERNPGWWLAAVDKHAGGGKHPENDTWTGGFNHFSQNDEDWLLSLIEEAIVPYQFGSQAEFVAVFNREDDWRVVQGAGVKQDG